MWQVSQCLHQRCINKPYSQSLLPGHRDAECDFPFLQPATFHPSRPHHPPVPTSPETSTSISLVFLLVMVWRPVRRCRWEGRETTKSAQIRPDPLTHTHAHTPSRSGVLTSERWRGPVSMSHLIFISPPSPDPESSRPATLAPCVCVCVCHCVVFL